jgi:chemotaxis-related protein WspD
MTQTLLSAAGRLLDRQMPDEYLRERTEIVSAEKSTLEGNRRSIVIFRVGREWFGLPLAALQEIAEVGRAHKVPHHSGGMVTGIVSVRGELLLHLAIEIILAVEREVDALRPNSSSDKKLLLVCNRAGRRFAFTADQVDGVHNYAPGDLKPLPATLSKARAAYTAGVLHWQDKTIGCLNDDSLFARFDKGLA